MAELDNKSFFASIFGMSAAGAGIGAVGGGLVGLLAAILIAGGPTLDWYQAHPQEWWVFTASSAIVFFLVVAIVAALFCALMGALLGAGISFVVSSIFLSRSK